ncbi:hypothetical protein [Nocardioides gilvus]|uniref:hypothetical protein n=1 Tax=Nocardioides gilvus TaxID=1735589 RepID=UPI0013A5684E|nr:hypothetical protein [Nocardioides gilvus]
MTASSVPTPESQSSADRSGPGRPPWGLGWALWLGIAAVLLEATVLIGLGTAELVSLSSVRLAMGLSTAAFFLGYGALLFFCARGLWRREAWGRSIIVMGQLIQLGVAWSYRSATPVLALALAVTATVVLFAIFHPTSLRVLGDDEE